MGKSLDGRKFSDPYYIGKPWYWLLIGKIESIIFIKFLKVYWKKNNILKVKKNNTLLTEIHFVTQLGLCILVQIGFGCVSISKDYSGIYVSFQYLLNTLYMYKKKINR